MAEDRADHYQKIFKGVKLDPARIALIYGIYHPIQIHIMKKSLRAGEGQKKTTIEDILDIKRACDRWIEMIKEDEADE